jgi:pyruvate,orthophosphate dikinase
MQFRSIIDGACIALEKGAEPQAAIALPFVSTGLEAARLRAEFDEVKASVLSQRGKIIDVKLGVLIDLPRAALVAGELAQHMDFIAFGCDDFTQFGFGFSREDAEAQFLGKYKEVGILPISPFTGIDIDGVGKIIQGALAAARAVKPQIETGFCGEHGGDPASVEFAAKIGFNWVSCPPGYIPIARLAAAQAAVKTKTGKCD